MAERISLDNLHEITRYHPPDTQDRIAAHEAINANIEDIMSIILRVVPECAQRTTALNKCLEARMWANSAIALEGRI